MKNTINYLIKGSAALALMSSLNAATVVFTNDVLNGATGTSNTEYDITFTSAVTNPNGADFDISLVAGAGYTAAVPTNNENSGDDFANIASSSGDTLVPFTFTIVDPATGGPAALPAGSVVKLTFTDIDLNEQLVSTQQTSFSAGGDITVSAGDTTFTANGSGAPTSAANQVDLTFGALSTINFQLAGGLNGGGTQPANRNFQIFGHVAIPEPTSAALLGLGGLALLGRRKRA